MILLTSVILLLRVIDIIAKYYKINSFGSCLLQKIDLTFREELCYRLECHDFELTPATSVYRVVTLPDISRFLKPKFLVGKKLK